MAQSVGDGYRARVDSLLEILFEAIAEPALIPSLSRRASYSRRHLHRLFQERLHETPAHMRRRLVLETRGIPVGRNSPKRHRHRIR